MEYTISIYKDKKQTLIFSAMGFDENGVRRDFNEYSKMLLPYDNKLIGQKFRETFEICFTDKKVDSKSAIPVYKSATGINSWSKFVKDWLLISIEINKEGEYMFIPHQRCLKPSKCYLSIVEKKQIFSSKLSDEEIGKIVMETFELCK